jgi:spermidine/putrescine-binding protein
MGRGRLRGDLTPNPFPGRKGHKLKHVQYFDLNRIALAYRLAKARVTLPVSGRARERFSLIFNQKELFPMRKLFVLLLLPIFGLITGCAPSKPATLTVYTYSSFPTSLVKQIQKDFKTNYKTDVVVKTFGDTGPIFNRLVQEKRHPKADVVIGLDSNYAFRAKKAGLFQAYKPKQAANLRRDVVFDPQFYLTPYDYGYIVFNYDSKNVKRVPTSHKDLLSPIYKDQIVVRIRPLPRRDRSFS